MYSYFKNVSQKFRLKLIDEMRNYFLKEIKQTELMSRKNKKVCKTLNYIQNFLVLASKITGCISVSVFALGIISNIIKYLCNNCRN